MALDFLIKESTYQADFVSHKTATSRTKHAPEVSNDAPTTLNQKASMDMETMGKFSDRIYVPFGLYTRPKECISVQPPVLDADLRGKDHDEDNRRKARGKRPRVYLVPQICLDDLPEDIVYGKNGLIDNIYTSDWRKAVELSLVNRKYKEVKTVSVPPKENVRFTPSYPCTPLVKGSQNYASAWDKLQLRSDVDKTEMFRTEYDANRRNQKTFQVPEVDEDEIRKALAKDSLRLPYQRTVSSYNGYIPKTPVGVSLCKKEKQSPQA